MRRLSEGGRKVTVEEIICTASSLYAQQVRQTVIYAVMGVQGGRTELLCNRAHCICSVAAALIRWNRVSRLPGEHLSPQVTFLVSGCALTVKPYNG